MWSTPEYLKRCEELKACGGVRAFEMGQKVARGFADLGFEEFVLLPGNKLLSLYSGTTSELPHDHERFFFVVPTCDELVNEILKSGYDIVSVSFPHQRSWVITLTDIRTGDMLDAQGNSLELSLINGLIRVLS